MGKLKSFIKLEGTLDGLTFYKSQDGYLVRTKGGISKSRMLKDPAFKRTRENFQQFGLNAKAGTLLRDAVGPMLSKAKDSKLSSRMLKLMNEIKNFDSTSVRGQRSVYLGLETAAGKQLLKGFDFNARAHLQSVLNANFFVDTTTGVLVIPDFISQEQLSATENATHVSFRTAFVNLNFNTRLFNSSYSQEVILPIDLSASTITLTPDGVPAGDGIQFHLLLIEFYQEINGVQYPLLNGAHNVLNLVALI
ncbi:MAG: hypothetical protein R6V74_03010 [Lutibacter sp.]